MSVLCFADQIYALITPPLKKEIDRKFETLKNQCQKLRENIDELSPGALVALVSIVRLAKAFPSEYPALGSINLVTLTQDLQSLEEIIGQVKAHDLTRDSKQAHSLGEDVIEELALLWKELTGRDATYTTDVDTSERQGDFITFLTAAAEIIGIDPKPLPERFRRLKEKGDA